MSGRTVFCRFFFVVISKYKHHLLLHLIIFIWGFTGILGKLISLDAISIVWYRVLIAFLSLGVGMYFLRKNFRLPSKKRGLQIALIGVVVGLHWVTFYHSIQLSTASLGILCLSTTTLHVAWIEPIVMKRRVSWIELLFGFIVIYGIYFVSGDFNATEYKALAYGLASAFFAAVFAVFNAKFSHDVAPSAISFYEMVAAFVFLSLVLAVQGRFSPDFFTMHWSDFFWLLFLGIICTSFAFLATIQIMKVLGAFTVSLSINLEPVYTILLAIFILNENELLGMNFYIGAVVIVLVVIANAAWKSWSRKQTVKR